MYTDFDGVSTAGYGDAAIQSSAQRVAVYVDGLNLYYGLKAAGWRRYYWLDLRRLAENLLRPGQALTAVRYFTARFSPSSADPMQHIRQDTYLQALATLPDLSIHYGYHQPKVTTCSQCGAILETYEEKMTDVNIAIAMLADAQDNAYDRAIVISADADLAGPVGAIRNRYANKQVIVAFPPKRISNHLRQVATAAFTVGRRVISSSQLPDIIANPDGYAIARPPRWR